MVPKKENNYLNKFMEHTSDNVKQITLTILASSTIIVAIAAFFGIVFDQFDAIIIFIVCVVYACLCSFMTN